MFSVVGGILIGAVLLIGGMFSMIEIGNESNRAIILASFSLAEIPNEFSREQASAVDDMRSSFSKIDTALDENETSTDPFWIKSVFMARYFGIQQLSKSDIASFVESMASNGTVSWIEDIRPTAEGILSVVHNALYSGTSNTTHAMIYELVKDDTTPFKGADFASPISPSLGDWRNYVTSEYGVRPNPTSEAHEQKMHNGIDIAPPYGSDIRAVQSGIVIIATRSSAGYGNHIVINHGGQITTLYGHCSNLYVQVGDVVTKEQVIATVGSTGNSTGPHLHFEVVEGAQPVNPRLYLP